METIETIIPDNKGNHLVVVLYFYENSDKENTFLIPDEFLTIEIADININKLYLDKPLGVRSLFGLCDWLISQFMLYPNAVFSFICSIDEIESRHQNQQPQEYRWSLFEVLYERTKARLRSLKIDSKNIIVGPEGYETFAKVFYREKHAPIIHLVTAHLTSKYR